MRRATVLAFYNRISVFYSLYPILTSRRAGAFDFTQSLEHCLADDPNDALLIVRFFEGGHRVGDRIDTSVMRRLRDRYRRIVFFDDGDGAGATRFEVLPYADIYAKRQLFHDRDVYRSTLYGHQLYTDRYARTAGVRDDRDYDRRPIRSSAELRKLRIAWNLGAGSYPVRPLLQKLGVALARWFDVRRAAALASDPRSHVPRNGERHDVHARFRLGRRPTVAYQRERIAELIEGDARFLSGPARPARYRREMREAKVTLSPFGAGEICFRDFEAILNHSLLLKPDMDHVETWPPVYVPNETYVPFRWDLSDLRDRVEQCLADDDRRRRIARTARRRYLRSVGALDARVDALCGWLGLATRSPAAAPELARGGM